MEFSIYFLYNTIVDESTNRFFHAKHFTINIMLCITPKEIILWCDVKPSWRKMLITRTIYDTAKTSCLVFWVVWLVVPSFWNYKSSILNCIINIIQNRRKCWLLSSDNVNHWLELCHQGHFFNKVWTNNVANPKSTVDNDFYGCIVISWMLWRFSVPDCVRCFCSQIHWYETELNDRIVFSFKNPL